MFKRIAIFIVLLLVMVALTAACSSDDQDPVLPEEVSTGGAILNTGSSLERGLYITEPQFHFAVDEDFFYSYDNGQPFGDSAVVIEIIDPYADRAIARKERHDLNPDQSAFADSAWIDAPGKYLLSVAVDGEVRATRYITIE